MKFEAQAEIQQKLDTLPMGPGVYLMKDERDEIIYVGKAINLRSRVRSYFHAPNESDYKTVRLVERIRNIEFIITESELEALVLECNLIKKYKPHFNIRLKDDKRYPYIKVTWQEPFPKVFLTRRMDNDGARYFGPFTAVWAVHETLDTLRKVFPYLTCDRDITGKDHRACLYYDIGLCLAPCIGAASRDEYRAMIDRLCLFLEGKAEEVTAAIRAKLDEAVQKLEFERAARYRDQLQALARIAEHQKVVSVATVDQDVIAFAQEDGDACVQVFFVRGGKLLGREFFVLEGTEGENAEHVLSSFVKQFYDEAASIPPEIVLPEDIDEAKIIETWLQSRRGQTVMIQVPHQGLGKELVDMAAENAKATLVSLKAQWLADENKQMSAVAELQEALRLDNPPLRMECYDISNTQGTNSVGAMVVFERGAAKKSDYRKFKIKTVEGANDFASLQEVLRRRFKRLVDAKEEEHAAESAGEGETVGSVRRNAPDVRRNAQLPGKDESWKRIPDLVIIDGGKGQLSAAHEVFRDLGIEGVNLISLAKQEEQVFVLNRPDSLRLGKSSEALKLLQRIRDEAHRFGITYHRNLRAKRGLASQLDSIPGIGPRRRRALLARFGSLDKIREASVEELATVEGMSRSAAKKLKDML
ncbi:MAG: excinuclease ABC subunit UvrC [Chloroflexi bacterium]|nr:excinuclease ABC subunit UvrC [Chloroflexota bacterium]